MINFQKYTEDKSVAKLISVVLLIFMAMSIRPLLDVVLLTFIFCFLFYNFENFIRKYLSKIIKVNDKPC